MKADVAKPARAVNGKAAFYRQSRAWHGYLSAFAFLALIFFAVTGLLLNHPEWTPSRGERPATESQVTLNAADLAAARATADPARALAAAVGRRTPLLGEFQSGEIVDDEAMLRLEGVKGASDLVIDMATGETQVTVTRARLVDTLNELHRGKNAGAVWKAVIDLSAVVILALSVIGYALFFSLRFRLRTSLILTAASLAGLAGVVLLLTP